MALRDPINPSSFFLGLQRNAAIHGAEGRQQAVDGDGYSLASTVTWSFSFAFDSSGNTWVLGLSRAENFHQKLSSKIHTHTRTFGMSDPVSVSISPLLAELIFRVNVHLNALQNSSLIRKKHTEILLTQFKATLKALESIRNTVTTQQRGWPVPADIAEYLTKRLRSVQRSFTELDAEMVKVHGRTYHKKAGVLVKAPEDSEEGTKNENGTKRSSSKTRVFLRFGGIMKEGNKDIVARQAVEKIQSFNQSLLNVRETLTTQLMARKVGEKDEMVGDAVLPTAGNRVLMRSAYEPEALLKLVARDGWGSNFDTMELQTSGAMIAARGFMNPARPASCAPPVRPPSRQASRSVPLMSNPWPTGISGPPTPPPIPPSWIAPTDNENTPTPIEYYVATTPSPVSRPLRRKTVTSLYDQRFDRGGNSSVSSTSTDTSFTFVSNPGALANASNSSTVAAAAAVLSQIYANSIPREAGRAPPPRRSASSGSTSLPLSSKPSPPSSSSSSGASSPSAGSSQSPVESTIATLPLQIRKNSYSYREIDVNPTPMRRSSTMGSRLGRRPRSEETTPSASVPHKLHLDTTNIHPPAAEQTIASSSAPMANAATQTPAPAPASETPATPIISSTQMWDTEKEVIRVHPTGIPRPRSRPESYIYQPPTPSLTRTSTTATTQRNRLSRALSILINDMPPVPPTPPPPPPPPPLPDLYNYYRHDYQLDRQLRRQDSIARQQHHHQHQRRRRQSQQQTDQQQDQQTNHYIHGQPNSNSYSGMSTTAATPRIIQPYNDFPEVVPRQELRSRRGNLPQREPIYASGSANIGIGTMSAAGVVPRMRGGMGDVQRSDEAEVFRPMYDLEGLKKLALGGDGWD
ncbi:hypothetical protein DFH27DRAFT_529025 [Peziza echinospora]|nr:hypothetical protein DFH27DRAFT_529025 [Peziza echinospora]